ncbi:hypothetical protein ZWY2020_014622 [Hordeum vulgare]|nr:hypothetical protein ZWY2020_014622 [Hordeum vulgare]
MPQQAGGGGDPAEVHTMLDGHAPQDPQGVDEAVISNFSDGVTNLKMKEELSMSDEMSTALEMFNLENKCARDEEGRLSLLGLQAAEPEREEGQGGEARSCGARSRA